MTHKFKAGAWLVDKQSMDKVCQVISYQQGVDCLMYMIRYDLDEYPVLRSERVLSRYYQSQD